MTSRKYFLWFWTILILLGFVSVTSLLSSCKSRRNVNQLSYVKPFLPVENNSFSIVFLSSMEGFVEPCGCTSEPLGGIARLTTVFKDIKSVVKDRMAIIDAGNLLFETPTRHSADRCQDEKRIELLLSSLSALGLTTTVPGPLDQSRGETYRDQLYERYSIKPLTTMKIITGPDFSVGIVGVKDDGTISVDTLRKDLMKSLQHDDIKKVKAVIALSQMPVEKTKELFFDVPSVDIVIQGQPSSYQAKTPHAVGTKGPYLIEGGRQGQYFPVVILKNLKERRSERISYDDRDVDRQQRIELLTTRISVLVKQVETANKDRKAFLVERLNTAKKELEKVAAQEKLDPLSGPNFDFRAFPLTKKIVADPLVDKNLQDYEKSIPILVKKCEENIECPKADEKTLTYVGVDVCKSCHQEAYDVWKKAIYTDVGRDDQGNEIKRDIGHSKAWKTLVDDNKDADRSCIGCHSIGFMEKGGYCKAFEVDFRKDVQCESCHGPGSLHAKTGDKTKIKRKVSEETCRACHQVPHIETYESFNYEEKLMRVLGKGHGEALLKELTHKFKKKD